MKKKKQTIGLTFIVFLVVLSLFAMVALYEYNRAVDGHKREAQEALDRVQNNLENIISSRMISMKNLVAYIEMNGSLTQDDYATFSQKIYESNEDVVNSMTLITDTTITHIYPYIGNESAIGVDLAQVPGQRELILYAKETMKEVFAAPVNLVEGGVGIIVRAPVAMENAYYGQVAIIFNYEETLKASGIIEIADTYFVELASIDALKGEETMVWRNFDGKMDHMIRQTIGVYESEILIAVKPVQGWHGTTFLFTLICVLGVGISTLASIGTYKVFTINQTLQQTNLDLESTIKRLVDSESKLKSQYDKIRKQEQYIKYLADHDALTGLSNRRRFLEILEAELEGNTYGSVVLLDLDNFKNINDTLGHLYGDKILSLVSRILEETLIEGALVFRLGGDEFIVLIREHRSPEEVNEQIEAIINRLNEGVELEQVRNHITASFGVSAYPEDGCTVEELMLKADIAMYSAKKSGKNSTVFFTENMVSDLSYRVQVEKNLHDLLETGGFELNYQPIVNSKSGEIQSFEALLRIKDRSMGPADFIPIAEETGLIVSIGRWVIDSVVWQLNLWRAANVPIKPIAVNFSPRQINDSTLIDYLKWTLEENKIPHHWIEVEITENVLIENREENIKVLRAIKEMGIKISLDDFGTGYSSLNYLTFMPVDQVKLDKTLKDKFIAHKDMRVLEGLVSIVHGLDLTVVVEGVEEIDEFIQLSRHQFDFMQGYLFSRPVSAIEVEEMLKENKVLIERGS